VLVMSREGKSCVGAVTEVLTEERLSATYGRRVRIRNIEGRTLCFAELKGD
jgi:ABC-type cobalamin transport system ATPase subunit